MLVRHGDDPLRPEPESWVHDQYRHHDSQSHECGSHDVDHQRLFELLLRVFGAQSGYSSVRRGCVERGVPQVGYPLRVADAGWIWLLSMLLFVIEELVCVCEGATGVMWRVFKLEKWEGGKKKRKLKLIIFKTKSNLLVLSLQTLEGKQKNWSLKNTS